MRILVTGAGGFIGHHLVKRLKAEGHWVRGCDLHEPEYEHTAADEFFELDLRGAHAARMAVSTCDAVYALAADMGGMGFIGAAENVAAIEINNSLININTVKAAMEGDVEQYFLASSACVYPESRQLETHTELAESDAFPAWPDTSYGWEKLQAELRVRWVGDVTGMRVSIARFHNIYGPLGTWTGGREKAPAAICRKVIEAKRSGADHIEVWGDGEQTRTYCYIDDCIEGITRLVANGYTEPLNIGSSESVSVNELVDVAASAAGVALMVEHIDGPQGVRGRSSDNTLCREVLGWCPSTSLRTGIQRTYAWIESQMRGEA